MFDSGVSCHMMENLSFIHDLKHISPILIGLENGALAFARKEGSVKLNKRIKLNNVLYVPSLTCNLISIMEFCKELNCSVTFFDNFCVLQDCILWIPIGAGEQ